MLHLVDAFRRELDPEDTNLIPQAREVSKELQNLLVQNRQAIDELNLPGTRLEDLNMLVEKLNMRTPQAWQHATEYGYGSALLDAPSISDGLKEIRVRTGALAPTDITAAFLHAAQVKIHRTLQGRDNKSVDEEHLPTTDDKFRKWLEDNRVRNILRLGDILPGVKYDFLIRMNAYLFMGEKEPSHFAKWLMTKGGFDLNNRFLEGKSVIEAGTGPQLRDALAFIRDGGADKVVAVDKSSAARKLARKIIADLQESGNGGDQEVGKKISMPDRCTDITAYLKKIRNQGEKVNVICGNSVFHYYDIEPLKDLLRLMLETLNDQDGYFAFAVKMPDGRFNRSGQLLVRDQETITNSNNSPFDFVRNKGSMNLDGQIRFSRSPEAWRSIIEDVRVEETDSDGRKRIFGFEVITSTRQNIAGYEIANDPQEFFNLICKKVPRN